MSSFIRPLLLLLLLAGTSLSFAARRARTPDEDPVALAALLVREGQWEKAQAVLVGVNPKQPGIDVVRFHTLTGLVHLHEREGEAAVSAFTAALAAATEGRELLELHLARAELLAGHADRCLSALDRSGTVGAGLTASWLLRAEAHKTLREWDLAFEALERGYARLPDQTELPRTQILFLIELGLTREARERAEALISRGSVTTADVLALSEALRRGGAHLEGQLLLEAALLQRGDDKDLLVASARAALQAGQGTSAGRFLERAAETHPDLYLEAAEAWRRSGDLDNALRVNAYVPDPVTKARQRLGLLLEAEAFERAVALEDRVLRLGLDQEDRVAFGLAYAWFRLGLPSEAERWLKGITDPALFARATELRGAMAACSDEGTCR